MAELTVERTRTPEPDYSRFIIYSCIVGSRAYGLDLEGSDIDRRGIYLPPADLHWSIYGVPQQLVNNEEQTTYWELQKFMVLALKANPTILECLYTPLVELASPLALKLIEQREIFLSQLVYQSYNGYVLSQFKKLNQHLLTYGTIKWKHAMHLIRFLLCGIGLLRDGRLTLQVEEHRDQLLAIRRGEVTWEEINKWRLRLHDEFEAVSREHTLPDLPDYEAANGLLLEGRRSMV